MSKKLLHVGCGQKTMKSLKGFDEQEWFELRVDIDPSVKPDVIGSLDNLDAVSDGDVQAVYSSHNLEHLYSHQVPKALSEFFRVLNQDGFVVITCPDLQSVAEQISKGRLLDALYQSQSGPIAAIDILFGLRRSIAAGNEFMAHRCGFTYPVMFQLLRQAGFASIVGGRRTKYYDLWALACKSKRDEDELRQLAACYLP